MVRTGQAGRRSGNRPAQLAADADRSAYGTANTGYRFRHELVDPLFGLWTVWPASVTTVLGVARSRPCSTSGGSYSAEYRIGINPDIQEQFGVRIAGEFHNPRAGGPLHLDLAAVDWCPVASGGCCAVRQRRAVRRRCGRGAFVRVFSVDLHAGVIP